MKRLARNILFLTALMLNLYGCDGDSGSSGLGLQFSVVGSDGVEARGNRAAEIDPATDNGMFTISYAFDRVQNENVKVALVNGEDRVELFSCCDGSCEMRHLECEFTNDNRIGCPAGLLGGDNITDHISEHGGLPLRSSIQFHVCEQACSRGNWDIPLFNLNQRCADASRAVVLR